MHTTRGDITHWLLAPRRTWAVVVFWLDDLNHKVRGGKPLSRRLCDYNDFLIIGERIP